MRTSTETLIAAMRIFSRDIISDDGVTNAFIAEAAQRLEEQQDRIKRLEEELERTKQDRNAIAKKTREPLLLKLDHANERISKLNDYVAALETAGDEMAKELSYGYDVDMWNKAKEAKP